MYNYHLVKQWHEDVDCKKKTFKTGDSEELDSSELSFNRTYVRQKLEHGLTRVWSVRMNLYVYMYIAAVCIALQYRSYVYVTAVVLFTCTCTYLTWRCTRALWYIVTNHMLVLYMYKFFMESLLIIMLYNFLFINKLVEIQIYIFLNAVKANSH